jgi:hypothetical protein
VTAKNSVKPNALASRPIGPRRRQNSGAPDGGNPSHDAARDSEQEALDEKLPEQAALSGANRRPNGEFLASALRSRHQQVGDVGTGEYENDRHRERKTHDRDPEVG